MTDFPDNITVAKCHPFRGDNFYVTDQGSDRSGNEYVRRDPAVLAALPEVQALVVAAVREALKVAALVPFRYTDLITAEDISRRIIDLIPEVPQ
jgi:hypothetical protein